MGQVRYDFEDETVLVTGGSSGIGREVATAFAAAGASVVVADVREEPREPDGVPTHERIEAAGGQAAYVETDVSEPDDVRAAVEAAGEFGGLDVMVNNAGIADRKTLFDATPEAFDRIMGVNARGVLFGCQIAAEDMLVRDDPGVIVNTASISADLAQYDHVMYDASKGAVKMITRATALELSDVGIRVNAIAPGFTATYVAGADPDDTREKVADGKTLSPTPLGRAAEPEEIAPHYLHLCSDASSYVTGEMLHVDGGYHVV